MKLEALIATAAGIVFLTGCARATQAPISQPSAPFIDLTAFRRVWIAGFVTGAPPDVDVNAETVRLLRRRLNPGTVLRVIEAEPLAIHDESVLSDVEHWKSLGEEYLQPLIVTGVVRLVTARPVPADSASTRPTYRLRKGFVLETTFVFIDGRTGEVVARQERPKETLYGADQRASTLSLYFQLMDRVIPEFLRVFRSAGD